MSHSVFRDFDDEQLTETTTKNDIADQNLIVFINKNGGVTVDQSALQDLIGESTTTHFLCAFSFAYSKPNVVHQLRLFTI